MQISTNDAQWAFLKPLSAMSFSPQYHSQSFHVNVELRAGLKLLIAVFLLHEMKVIKPLFGIFFYFYRQTRVVTALLGSH